MGKSEIIEILTQANKETKEKYKSRIIGLFGSYARNEETIESDIDILVEKTDDISLFELSGLKIYLEEKLKIKVDIVTTAALREEIKPYVLKDLIYL